MPKLPLKLRNDLFREVVHVVTAKLLHEKINDRLSHLAARKLYPSDLKELGIAAGFGSKMVKNSKKNSFVAAKLQLIAVALGIPMSELVPEMRPVLLKSLKTFADQNGLGCTDDQISEAVEDFLAETPIYTRIEELFGPA